jgi:hypothetical protein
MSKIHFNAVRKRNDKLVQVGAIGNKEVALFSCDERELEIVGKELRPVRDVVECVILGYPSNLDRQIRACDFDLYEVAK